MQKLIARGSALASTVYYSIISTSIALAVTDNIPPTLKTNIESLAFRIINYILGAAGLVAVIYLILGGFSYITASGNEEQTKKATKTLFNAVIGLVIIFAAYAIVVTVQRVVFGQGGSGGVTTIITGQ